MGLYGGELLGIEVPQSGKRLLAIVETDGCALDGVAVAAGCWPGRRTLRIEDYGKVAATFVDVHTGRAVRIAPRCSVRERAREWAPEARSRWESQLLGYQRMPSAELLTAQPVRLAQPVAVYLGRPGRRATCALCGEEVLSQREVRANGQTLCRACAGAGYYTASEIPFSAD